jgi:hypothetical protein
MPSAAHTRPGRARGRRRDARHSRAWLDALERLERADQHRRADPPCFRGKFSVRQVPYTMRT